MSDPKPVTRNIPFYTTMTMDEYEPGAVLRSKWLDYKNRLFPTADLSAVQTPNSFVPTKLVITSDFPSTYALGADSTDGIAVYHLDPENGSPSIAYTKKTGSGGVSSAVADAVFYDNGTDKLIYIIKENGNIDTYNIDTDAYVVDLITESGTHEQLMTVQPNYDDLFFVTDREVYRQSKGIYDGKVFDLPVGQAVLGMFSFQDKLVFVTQNALQEIIVSAWDTDSTNTAFSWSHNLGTWRALTAGVIDGKITVVTHLSDSENREYGGTLVVHQYTGGGFKKMNSITTDSPQFASFNYDDWFCDGTFLYAGVVDDDDVSGIYKFGSDGSIVFSTTFDFNSGQVLDMANANSSTGFRFLVSYFDNSDYYIAQFLNVGSSYSAYLVTSEYITGFLEDSYSKKKLKEFFLDFQKLNAGEEEGHFYYRVDEEDSWTELGQVDYDIDGEIDRIDFKRLLSGAVLPDFKTIQFRFTSQFGLNITGAGYKFVYTDRKQNDN